MENATGKMIREMCGHSSDCMENSNGSENLKAYTAIVVYEGRGASCFLFSE